ncbi:hypothetical protein CLV76_10264 [Marivita geojedonensis]|nr:hypothetical protein CLV76_10264 [Marivita geojedonensis]
MQSGEIIGTSANDAIFVGNRRNFCMAYVGVGICIAKSSG